jgi:hypothetical protein
MFTARSSVACLARTLGRYLLMLMGTIILRRPAVVGGKFCLLLLPLFLHFYRRRRRNSLCSVCVTGHESDQKVEMKRQAKQRVDRCRLDAAVDDSLLPAKNGGDREYSRCCPTSTIFRPNKGKDHSHKHARVVDYVATLGMTATYPWCSSHVRSIGK